MWSHWLMLYLPTSIRKKTNYSVWANNIKIRIKLLLPCPKSIYLMTSNCCQNVLAKLNSLIRMLPGRGQIWVQFFELHADIVIKRMTKLINYCIFVIWIGMWKERKYSKRGWDMPFLEKPLNNLHDYATLNDVCWELLNFVYSVITFRYYARYSQGFVSILGRQQ